MWIVVPVPRRRGFLVCTFDVVRSMKRMEPVRRQVLC